MPTPVSSHTISNCRLPPAGRRSVWVDTGQGSPWPGLTDFMHTANQKLPAEGRACMGDTSVGPILLACNQGLYRRV